VLELQIPLAPKVVGCLGDLHHDDILDADPPLAVRIVPWLVGDDHARLQGHLVVCGARTDALRSLVDIEE
jgi:hypothetical protein